MTIPSPRLDDRSFDDLYEEALAHMRAVCPEWRGDLSPGDPAAVLLDVFAYLTEVMLYRVNRLPEKAYIELLRLVGMRRRPPEAALVVLELRAASPLSAPLRVPRGTRISVDNDRSSREISFVLIDDATIAAGSGNASTTRAIAMACELVNGELLGMGTGEAGRKFRIARAPVIAPPPIRLRESQLFLGNELLVGVEADATDTDLLPFEIDGKRFRKWYETETFSADSVGWPRVYRMDRLTGEVEFPPATLLGPSREKAGIAALGREIRIWYARGGGQAGNVAANSLSRLVDPVPGITVTNPEPARGGRDEESLEAVVRRAPEELSHRDRAVTASDYEKLTLQASPAVKRVFVHTPADAYAEDRPGTVEVLVVLDPSQRSGAQRAVDDVRAFLDARRPLGSKCDVSLAPEKSVMVKAYIVAAPSEDPNSIRKSVENGLSRILSAAPVGDDPGWEFGRTLHVSNIYETLNSVPGVRHVVGEIELGQTPAPAAIDALEADADRPHTFYLGSGNTLFRSENDGLGWEPLPLALTNQETIVAVRSHPLVPNTLVVATRATGQGSWLYVSEDGGRSFPHPRFFLQGEEIRDVVWDAPAQGSIAQSLERALWIASSGGLRRARLARSSPRAAADWQALEQVELRTADRSRSLTIDRIAATYRGGKLFLAALSRDSGEIHFGTAFPSEPIQLAKIWPWPAQQDRASPWSISFQRLDGHIYLWMGSRAEGHDQPGCRAADVTDPSGAFRGWAALEKGWRGGTCTVLATRGAKVFAATATGGVLELTLRGTASEWAAPRISSTSRYPSRDQDYLEQRLTALAISPNDGGTVVLAGGDLGLVLRHDEMRGGLPLEAGCYHARKFDATTDFVTLPRGGVFSAANLHIEVVRDT